MGKDVLISEKMHGKKKKKKKRPKDFFGGLMWDFEQYLYKCVFPEPTLFFSRRAHFWSFLRFTNVVYWSADESTASARNHLISTWAEIRHF